VQSPVIHMTEPLMCPGCFAFVSQPRDPVEAKTPKSGDIVICGCGTISIFDAKRRPPILRKPSVAEKLMIAGNASYQRLVAHRAERGL
jgi:hypothetical protein